MVAVCSLFLCLSLLSGPALPAASSPDFSREDWSTENTTLYVLMYHHLVEDPEAVSEWSITAQRFSQDLQWLKDHGYTFVLPSDLAAGQGLPERAVMLTFDDGYASFYRLAFPLLREHGAKAAVSLITQSVQAEEPGFLTWDMCREMADSGLVEIGSHTYALHTNHPVLGVQRRPDESQEDYAVRVFPDLEESVRLIETEVGAPPLLFAYPYGKVEPWSKDFVAGRFPVSVTSQEKRADLSGGTGFLPRYNITMDVSPSQILPA